MKDFKIEDAKTRFFKSKEDYLNFKQAWKAFHNNGHHVERGEWTTPHGNVKEYKRPLLDSSSYMLYNLLRGHDIKRGYTPLLESDNPLIACKNAMATIISTAKDLEQVNDHSRRYARQRINSLLLPFGETVSHQALAEIGVELMKYFGYKNVKNIEVEEWILFAAKEAAEKKLSLADRLKMRLA